MTAHGAGRETGGKPRGGIAILILKRKSYKLNGQAIRGALTTRTDDFLQHVERGLIEDKLSLLGWTVVVLAGLMLAGQVIRMLVVSVFG